MLKKKLSWKEADMLGKSMNARQVKKEDWSRRIR